MTARVLVVDDVELNVKLLEAKLSSEYFQVIPAYNGPTALELADTELPRCRTLPTDCAAWKPALTIS
jgi:two-component system cell cycle response regulator